jgi:hypothetical protein
MEDVDVVGGEEEASSGVGGEGGAVGDAESGASGEGDRAGGVRAEVDEVAGAEVGEERLCEAINPGLS